MSAPAVLKESNGVIARLTLNDPATLNAMTGQLLHELNAAFDDVSADPAVRVIVLTGAGRAFCSGANLTPPRSDGRNRSLEEAMGEDLNPLIVKMRTSAKPVLVAVNGPAAGAGVGLALAGDIVIAARSARFVLSFARIGAVLDAGTSLFVQQHVGMARAKTLALLGEPVSAEKAAEWGLIWAAVDDEQLLDLTSELATRMAAGPPLAFARMKQQLEAARTRSLSDVLEDELNQQIESFATEDLREGFAAFRQKRAPKFQGR